MQIKSLQALFDPRTLHEKCCSERTGKCAQGSPKTPLRKRKLPPSFFKEPRHGFESCSVNSICTPRNEISMQFNDNQSDFVTSLPNDTIESILGQSDFHDLLIGSWNSGNNSRESSGFSVYDNGNFSPESYSESSDGSCSVSPVVQDLMCEPCDQQPAWEHFEQGCDTSNVAREFYVTDIQNLVDGPCQSFAPVYDNYNHSYQENEGFLPLLNEPLHKIDFISQDFSADQSEIRNSQKLPLPTFPQAFCGQSPLADNSKHKAHTENCAWNQTAPCYTYL